MKILFTEIAQNGSQYHLTDEAWLTGTGLLRTAPVQSELTLRRKGENRAEVQGTLCTGVRLTCDRCLTDYDFPVAAEFHLLLEVPEHEENWSVKELDNSTEIELMEVDEPAADLTEILRQQLFLSLPVKLLCSPDCRGLCPNCGANLNRTSCTCSSEARNSPFAALATWKKNK